MGPTVNLRRTLAATAACAGLAAVTASGAAQVFRTSTDMVLLSVTATQQGKPVAGLQREHFAVLEDGVPQDITVFAGEPQPIALSILLDASTSMEQKLATAADAAVGFCRRLRPGDVAQIITFNNDTEVRQTFTDDLGALERAIRQARPSGSTSLYTAMYVALNELNRVKPPADEPLRRQAIILLSDGEDTTSLLRYEEVLERAKRSDVAVFTIGLRDRQQTPRGFNEYDFVLRTMAQSTGGRVFFVDNPAQLASIYDQIADELATQYTIGYVSKNLKRDGAWRQVSVRINRTGLVARTKAGYYGPSKGQ